MKKQATPATAREHRWKAPSTKGVLTALFKNWRKIKPAEREAIERSVHAAHRIWLDRNSGVARSRRGGGRNNPLFGLSLEPFRDLRHPAFRRMIAEAVEANDCDFFVRLGEALRRKPKSIFALAPDNTVDGFLINGWFAKKPGETPPLACLTPAALAIVTKHFFTAAGITAAGVARRVERLGLIPASTQFDTVEKRSDGKLAVN